MSSNLTASRIKAFATLAVTLLAQANTVLSLMGKPALPFTSAEVEAAVSGTLGAIGSIYVWWTTSVVTSAAQAGNQVTKALKAGATDTNSETITTATATAADTDPEIEELADTVYGTQTVEQ
ncbi:MAG: SPP1 phage holin family protein [Bifidobacterium sp.]|jgi:hypothetical protein|nr:SPP1 phage holin family protein [Bifidobacterium sp.]